MARDLYDYGLNEKVLEELTRLAGLGAMCVEKQLDVETNEFLRPELLKLYNILKNTSNAYKDRHVSPFREKKIGG